VGRRADPWDKGREARRRISRLQPGEKSKGEATLTVVLKAREARVFGQSTPFVDPTTACLEPPLENAFSEDSRETSELTQS